MKKEVCLFVKRVLSVVLCLLTILSFASCGLGEETTKENSIGMIVKSADDAIEQLKEAETKFGYENALSELTEKSTAVIDGDSYYRLQQNYDGIPVYGRTIVCATDENGKNVDLIGNLEDVSEDLNTTPSVSIEQIENTVSTYFIEELSFNSDFVVNLDYLTNDYLVVYTMSEDERDALVYRIYLDEYELLIDAHTGELVQSLTTVYTETEKYTWDGYSVDLNRTVDEEGRLYYSLVDDNRKIRIYDANNAKLTYELYDTEGDLVVDQKNNLLKTDVLTENLRTVLYSTESIVEPISYNTPSDFDEKAIKLLSNLQITYDFYEEVLQLNGIGSSPVWIFGVYDEYVSMFDVDNAYCWGYAHLNMPECLLSFNSKCDNNLDTVAHEYTHGVERRRSNMLYSRESGAIMEALSDIYGELVEFYNKDDGSVWIHGSRNISDPAEGDNPDFYKGENWGNTKNSTKINDWGHVHSNSTVISHAAYLMWNGIDGAESKKISTDDLAKLWYRAMLMMPADCNFNECRQLVELAATSMKLTKAQIECVSEAFDKVGITGNLNESEDVKYKIAPTGTLSVYNGKRELYGDFTLEIGKKKTIFSTEPSGFRRTVKVDKSKAYEFELEEGNYIFTITDNANPANKEQFSVNVNKNNKDKNISIYTTFGFASVKGTVSEIKEIDGVETNVPINNAIVTVNEHKGDTVEVIEVINMADKTDGFFQTYLAIGDYSIVTEAEGYASHTYSFSVTENKAINLEIVLKNQNTQTNNLVYLQFIEKAILEKAYDHVNGSGFLYDMDEDNVDELVILNVYSEIRGEYFPAHAYSVYDIENGNVVIKCDKEILFYDAGGPHGYVGVVNYLGNQAFLVYTDNGETGYQARRETNYTIYDPRDMQVVMTATLDYISLENIQAKGCYVNGKPCSYNDYLSVVESIEPIKIAEIYANDESDGSMELYDLMRYIQTTSGMVPEQNPNITIEDAKLIVDSVWGEYVNRKQGFDWKIFEDDNLIKDGVEYYCFTLQTNSKYGANDWTVVYYMFINSVTSEYSYSLFDGFKKADISSSSQIEHSESTSKEGNSTITEQELIGEWVIDSEYTMEITGKSMKDLYGSAYKYGNGMTFSSDGIFEYYAGFCYGKGTYNINGEKVVVNITEGESGLGEQKLLVIKDGVTRIAMDQYQDGDLVFWVKADNN